MRLACVADQYMNLICRLSNLICCCCNLFDVFEVASDEDHSIVLLTEEDASISPFLASCSELVLTSGDDKYLLYPV